MDLTFIITIGAPLLIIYFIIKSDRFPEPTHMVIKTFMLGVLLCIPAGILNGIIIQSDEQSFIAGLTEEPLKFLVLYFYIRPKKFFNEPMDAIVYGTVISLGFATLENIEYVYLYYPETDSLLIAVIRAFTAIPMHAVSGIIMGYYFGLYAFSGKRLLLLYSLAVPIGFHALYNFLTFSLIHMMALLILAILFVRMKHRELSKLQANKDSEEEEKLV